jgi:hypothetical protein
MGFLDWIRGKRRQDPSHDCDQDSSAPRAPKVVAGLDDEHSPYVVIDNGRGTVLLMDKDAWRSHRPYLEPCRGRPLVAG